MIWAVWYQPMTTIARLLKAKRRQKINYCQNSRIQMYIRVGRQGHWIEWYGSNRVGKEVGLSNSDERMMSQH